MKNSLWMAAVLLTPLTFSVSNAQTSGISHPDETVITTSTDVSTEPATQAAAVHGYASEPAVPSELHEHLQSRTDVSRVTDGGSAPVERYTSAAPVGSSAVKDVDGEVVTRLPGPSNQLPVGTLVNTRIRQAISTLTTPQGTIFTAELTQPVLRDGVVLLPAGSVLSGRVTEVHGGKRISGPAAIHLQTLDVALPDGTSYPFRGQVIDTGTYRHTKVDSEGTILRRDHAVATISELGLAAGGGAAVGGVVAGLPGALIGGAVGAGAGTVVWLKQDKEAQLPAQTLVTFSLDAPLTVSDR